MWGKNFRISVSFTFYYSSLWKIILGNEYNGTEEFRSDFDSLVTMKYMPIMMWEDSIQLYAWSMQPVTMFHLLESQTSAWELTS